MQTHYDLASLIGSSVGEDVETERLKLNGVDLFLVYPIKEIVPIKGFILGKPEDLDKCLCGPEHYTFNLEANNEQSILRSSDFQIFTIERYGCNENDIDIIAEIEFNEISIEHRKIPKPENTEKYIEFHVVGPMSYFSSIVGIRKSPRKEDDLRVTLSLGIEDYEVRFEDRTYSYSWPDYEYKNTNVISVNSKSDVDDHETFINKSTEIVDSILLISSIFTRSKVQWFRCSFCYDQSAISTYKRIDGDFDRQLSINHFRKQFEIKECIEKSYKSIQKFENKINFGYIMSKIVDADHSKCPSNRFSCYYKGLERLVRDYAEYYDICRSKKGSSKDLHIWRVLESLFNDLGWNWEMSCIGAAERAAQENELIVPPKNDKPNFLVIRNEDFHGSPILNNDELIQETRSISFILSRILFYIFEIEDIHRYSQLTEDMFYSPLYRCIGKMNYNKQ